MIEDSEIKPASHMAVYSYISSTDSGSTKITSKTLPDYIAEATANSVIPKLKSAYKLSQRSDYDLGGTWSSQTFYEDSDLKAKTKNALEQWLGTNVTVDYSIFGEINFLHMAWQCLEDFYGYNPETNEAVNQSNEKGFAVYLEDIQLYLSNYTLEITDPVQVNLYGISPRSRPTPFRSKETRPFTPIGTIPDDVDPYANFIFTYKDTAGNKQTYTVKMGYLNYISSSIDPEILLGEIEEEFDPNAIALGTGDDGLDATYLMIRYQAYNTTHYLSYKRGSQTNNYLERIFRSEDVQGQYLPRVYARLWGRKVYEAYDSSTNAYKSLSKLCKKLGFDWINWIDTLHENMSNLKYVKEIFLNFGVAANDKDPVNTQYLYAFFAEQYRKLPDKTIQGSAILKNNLSLALGNRKGLTQSIEPGLFYKSGTDIRLGDAWTVYGLTFDGIHLTTRQGVKTEVGHYTAEYTRGVHKYFKQLTATTYSEVAVVNMSSYCNFDGKVMKQSYDSEDLLVPLDLSLKHDLQGVKLERLYAKSMHIIINTVQKVKEKWYQKGIFKVAMFIIGAVITFFFPPAGVAAYGWVAVAAFAIVVNVAINIAINLAFKLLINLGLDGNTISFIAAIVAVIAIAWGGYNVLTKTGKAAVTASKVLTIVNPAFSMANQGLQHQFQVMMKAYQNHMLKLSEKEKALDQRAEELGLHRFGTADTFIFEVPNTLDIRLGEDAEDYFNRAIHLGNPGTLVFNVQENFVDSNLRLPTLHQLLQQLEQFKNV